MELLAALGGLLLGIAAVGTILYNALRDKGKIKEVRQEHAADRRRDLQAFVAAQTETLLQGYQGVFDEYKRQAAALIVERIDLIARVGTLEASDNTCKAKVKELEAQVESLKATVAQLSERRP